MIFGTMNTDLGAEVYLSFRAKDTAVLHKVAGGTLVCLCFPPTADYILNFVHRGSIWTDVMIRVQFYDWKVTQGQLIG